jgi:hypothetical protein
LAGIASLAVLLGWGCAGSAPPTETIPLGPDFSGRAAAGHARALAKLPDRSPDSKGDQRARRYLSEAFAAAGASVEVLTEGERRHLVATLEGQSKDVVLFVAIYPSLAESNWVDGSGAGLLVELARVSALEVRPYTLRFALADLRVVEPAVRSARPQAGSLDSALSAAESWGGSLGETRQWLIKAGESLANAFAMSPSGGSLRAVVALDASARPGLRLARDLRSHPLYRGLFWDSASSLGQSSMFPDDGGWASPRSLHSGFYAAAEGRVLGLVDEQIARADLYLAPISGEPSEETLEALGSVIAHALDGLMQRLAKIDSFVP